MVFSIKLLAECVRFGFGWLLVLRMDAVYKPYQSGWYLTDSTGELTCLDDQFSGWTGHYLLSLRLHMFLTICTDCGLVAETIMEMAYPH